ncbi:MAG: hypothetical protein WC368_06645 [Candidatus Cloacimonadaceae bacterium]|jgi:glycosyltransferase involved in cell wall biosynthesis|nr:hypothetical protein [Candidatus Cloacimonadota bacterium]
MKNILFISSYFPPAGGVGVQRISKFCKYLSRKGFTPYVLTPPAWSVRRDKDLSMLSELPSNLEQINPGFIDIRRLIPGEIAKYMKAWQREHFFPDNMIQWVRKAQKQVIALINIKHIDVVYITLPHFSLLEIANTIKANSDVPVILDMRDPFSFNFYVEQEQDLRYQERVRLLESKAFSVADIILNVTKNIHNEYCKLYPEWETKFHYMPNGFDDEDYPREICDINSLPNENLTLCYTGSYSSMSSILPYRDAIEKVFDKHQIRIRLNLLTPTAKKRVRKDFRTLHKHGLLNYHGLLPHKEAIAYQLQSHIMLYPCPTYFSGKIYEYLRSNRPVLCLVNKMTDSHKLIQDAGVGIFVVKDEQPDLQNALLSLHKQWHDGTLSLQANQELIGSFSCEQRSNRLIQIIDSL